MNQLTPDYPSDTVFFFSCSYFSVCPCNIYQMALWVRLSQ